MQEYPALIIGPEAGSGFAFSMLALLARIERLARQGAAAPIAVNLKPVGALQCRSFKLPCIF